MKYKLNIILISIDDLRWDAIGCEENKQLLEEYSPENFVSTKTIDSIAEEGVRFSCCLSTSSYTPAPHASMLTGAYPSKHGIVSFAGKLSNSVRTLAEILNEKGYICLASIEHVALKLLDITRGFHIVNERYNDEFSLFDAIKKGGGPFFLFFHFMDVHSPYYFAKGSSLDIQRYNKDYLDKIEYIGRKYSINVAKLLEKGKEKARKEVRNFTRLSPSMQRYAEIRAFDYLLRCELKQRGRLFAEIIPLYLQGVTKFSENKFRDILLLLKKEGILNNSILIITSDHGESICEWRGRVDFMNSFWLYEPSIRVPLIIKTEGLPKGKIINTPVSIIDIVPTVLDLLNIKVDYECDGKSLIPLVETGEPPHKFIFSETWVYEGGWDQFGNLRGEFKAYLRQLAVRYGHFKYVLTRDEGTTKTEEALFDIENDIHERDNLFNKEDKVQISSLLHNVATESIGKRVLTFSSSSDLKLLEHLKALGYI
ncbi:MAG: hypothetical protein DRN29_03510 [Thermoplasmata archaeon]|nr:MAG: hypothetical protein DRN29_03510 [Thermoplasmata archaeon]